MAVARTAADASLASRSIAKAAADGSADSASTSITAMRTAPAESSSNLDRCGRTARPPTCQARPTAVWRFAGPTSAAMRANSAGSNRSDDRAAR